MKKEYDPHSGAYFDPKSSGKVTPGYAKNAFKIIDMVLTRKLTVSQALQDLERVADIQVADMQDVSHETNDERVCCRCGVMVTEDEGQYCATCKEKWEDLT